MLSVALSESKGNIFKDTFILLKVQHYQVLWNPCGISYYGFTFLIIFNHKPKKIISLQSTKKSVSSSGCFFVGGEHFLINEKKVFYSYPFSRFQPLA